MLCPMRRSHLSAFNELMLELQSHWIAQEFSTADVVAEDECWELMGKIAAMIPRFDRPGDIGFDLDELDNDYEQIEKLFFTQASDSAPGAKTTEFNLDTFQPGLLFEMHRFNGKKKLLEANQIHLLRVTGRSSETSDQRTSPSRQAA